MYFNSIDMLKYILGDLKFAWGLRVHKCTQNVDVYSDFTKMKHIFLYVTTNIWYNSAKPYQIHQRGHLIERKKMEQGEMDKTWSINPLFAVTHKSDFFQLFSLLL